MYYFWAGLNVLFGSFETANDTNVILAMIESAAGLAALDDILDAPGIDGVFVGPFDLSIALTGSIQPTHAAVGVALDKVLAACRTRNKIATVMGATGQRASELLAMGFDLVAIGPDHAHLRDGARAALETARGGSAAITRSGY
ncbi:aldolase/citrate lyase family protein [Devosia sp.]|uniref:aldolase/citrate lyase family protein n=1 Tax=Devosia sp. TaxID=1871048 RepID=UPI0032650BEF